MIHHTLTVVLIAAMLMPPGICTCDAGRDACANHPMDSCAGPDACAGGHRAEEAGCSVGHPHGHPGHHPHDECCHSQASDDLADTSDSLPDLAPSWGSIVDCWLPPAGRPARARLSGRIPRPPIFIAHCSLVI